MPFRAQPFSGAIFLSARSKSFGSSDAPATRAASMKRPNCAGSFSRRLACGFRVGLRGMACLIALEPYNSKSNDALLRCVAFRAAPPISANLVRWRSHHSADLNTPHFPFAARRTCFWRLPGKLLFQGRHAFFQRGNFGRDHGPTFDYCGARTPERASWLPDCPCRKAHDARTVI